MQQKTNTNSTQSAIPAELLALIEIARTNTLSARRITEEIETVEEMSMADLVTIARACSASLTALNALRTKIAGEDEPEPTPAAVASTTSHLSLVDVIAA